MKNLKTYFSFYLAEGARKYFSKALEQMAKKWDQEI